MAFEKLPSPKLQLCAISDPGLTFDKFVKAVVPDKHTLFVLKAAVGNMSMVTVLVSVLIQLLFEMAENEAW
jgi:hypothetical protein